MSLRRAMFQSFGHVSSSGGTPTKVVKVMYISDGIFHNPDAGWNVCSQDDEDDPLFDSTGAASGFLFNSSGDDWDVDPEFNGAAIGDWSSIALQRTVYTYGGNSYSKNLIFSGLDTTKPYKLRIASRQGYDDPGRDNRTKVTVNGVTKYLENQFADTLYEQSFDIVNPASGVITVNVGTDAMYALFSATILEQY